MVLKREKYVKPSIDVFILGDELLVRQFDTCSIGKNPATIKDFKSEEFFKVSEEKMNYTEQKKFWDDWDNGAD